MASSIWQLGFSESRSTCIELATNRKLHCGDPASCRACLQALASFDLKGYAKEVLLYGAQEAPLLV